VSGRFGGTPGRRQEFGLEALVVGHDREPSEPTGEPAKRQVESRYLIHDANSGRAAATSQSPRRGASKVLPLRAGLVAALLAGLLAVACASAPNVVPGPSRAPFTGSALASDRVVFDSDRSGNYELYTMLADGSDTRALTTDSHFDSWWPRLSPGRTDVIFYRTPKGVHDTDFAQATLWTVHVDGSDLRELRPKGTDGWDQQGHAEWSPDGKSLTMFGGSGSNPQIFITDANGAKPVRVTDRPGTNIDPSWSPDGGTIVFVGCPEAVCFDHNYEIYTIPRSGGDARRLTSDDLRDHDPYFSPDGKSIAWLSRTDPTGPTGIWNIKIMNADGSAQRAVTHDSQINSKPSWSRDGTLIYFHRFEFAKGRWGIYTVRPDGSAMQELTKGAAGNSEFPSP